jgi:hypothetical protein
MSRTMYRSDDRGALQAVKQETYNNMFWGALFWQNLVLDRYGQYYAGSSWGGRLLWPANSALSEAQKKGGLAVRITSTNWPMGTVKGIQTWFRKPALVNSLEPLDVPVVPVRPDFFGGGVAKIDLSLVKQYAPYGFIVDLYIFGTYYNRVGVSIKTDLAGNEYVDYTVITEQFGAPACEYFHNATPPNPSIYYIQLAVGIKDIDGNLPEMPAPTLYRLIHERKVNAEIYPADNTILFPGQQVHILAEPIADRVLTEFTVQHVDLLAEATTEYSDTTAKGITSPYGYDDITKAKYTYGPVNSDVYVTAVAEGVEIEEEIQAGVEKTIQMTTTDCLVEEGSWSITGTNLPEDVEYSIDADGLITVFVPENVYDGNPGGRYYIDAQFEGYSQTKALRVWVTVASVAAYGTVWSAAGTLPDTPVAIFEASDKTVYITSETKVYTTTDFVTFSEVTLTGTRTGKFGNIAEAANGRLILLEANTSIGANARIWTKDPEDEGFTRRNDWAGFSNSWNTPMWVSAHPDSNVILFGASTSYSGANCLLTARNATTGAVLHTLDVPRGAISGYAYPAVRLDNGNWLISVVGAGICKVFKYVEGSGFTSVLEDADPTFSTLNLLYRESDDRVVLIGNESSTQWFSRYTTDGGTTWSDKTLLTVALNNQVLSTLSLKKNYLVAGAITDQIFYSTDTLATATAVTAALGGDISWIIKRRSGVLLAIARRSGGTNIWKSEA